MTESTADGYDNDGHTADEREVLKMSECHFCGAGDPLESHHIVPRRFDGSDSAENIATVCPTCHSKLEKLYNRRFYKELGVEKDRSIDEVCSQGDCYADATARIADRGEEMAVCDGHNQCLGYGCSKRPVIIATGGGELGVFCNDHGICRSGDCRSRGIVLVRYSENTTIRVCQDHADKYRSGE